MYEKMLAKAEEHTPVLDYVLTNFALIDEHLSLSPNYDQPAWITLVSAVGAPGKFLAPHLNPEIFRISAVPWRKLYSMDFVRRHSLRFPEGDYFFEDNSFHWITTLNAQRIGIVNQVSCFHRKGRAGQTTNGVRKKKTSVNGVSVVQADDGGSSKCAALGGFFSNINYIGVYIFEVFARRAHGKDYTLNDCVSRDVERKFSPGEYKIYVDEVRRFGLYTY
jgi:hypothetical protein